jgi:hypothetical protein
VFLNFYCKNVHISHIRIIHIVHMGVPENVVYPPKRPSNVIKLHISSDDAKKWRPMARHNSPVDLGFAFSHHLRAPFGFPFSPQPGFEGTLPGA